MYVARHTQGTDHFQTVKLRWRYAEALYNDEGATLDDIREVEATLVDTALVARRVLGASHPLTRGIEQDLRKSRDTLAEMLAARESGAASG